MTDSDKGSVEVRRVNVPLTDLSFTCENCGRAHTLHFNGGEMDGKECKCGWSFSLEIETIIFIVERPA